MTPALSWPRITGHGIGNSPFHRWTSVPQIPAIVTRTRATRAARARALIRQLSRTCGSCRGPRAPIEEQFPLGPLNLHRGRLLFSAGLASRVFPVVNPMERVPFWSHAQTRALMARDD